MSASCPLWMEATARQGAFIPPSANLVFDGNPDMLGLVDGTVVTTWTDESGSGNNLTTFSGSAGLTYKVNVQNGHASLRTNGLTSALAKTFTLNQPVTVYLVVKPITEATSTYYFDGNAALMPVYQQNTPPFQIFWYAGTQQTAFNEPANGTAWIGAFVFNGASSSAQLNNNAPVGPLAVGANNPGGICVGGRSNNNGGGFVVTADYLRVLVYNAAHSAGTVNAIIAGLDTMYAVY